MRRMCYVFARENIGSVPKSITTNSSIAFIEQPTAIQCCRVLSHTAHAMISYANIPSQADCEHEKLDVST